MSFAPARAVLGVLALGALTAPAVAGCNAGPDNYAIETVFDPCEPVVLVPDTDATHAERQGAVAGVAMWNELAGAHYSVDGEDPVEGVVVGDDAPRIPLHFDDAGGNFHGFYDDKRGEIFINTDLGGEKLAITIAHEVGHTAGLLHIAKEDRKSVMNNANLVVTPTKGDLAQLVNLWGSCNVPEKTEPGAPPK